MQNMIPMVEVIAKAYKLLIRLAGIIPSVDSPANAINGTRKVTMIGIKIAIKGNRLAGEVESERCGAGLRVIEDPIIALGVVSP